MTIAQQIQEAAAAAARFRDSAENLRRCLDAGEPGIIQEMVDDAEATAAAYEAELNRLVASAQ